MPKAEWTLGAVLKQGGYKTYFTGKWHLGEADFALPNAHGYDVMENCYLYHCNAYTYGDPTWFPDMPEELRAMYNKVTKGSMSGNAGQAAHEDFKINGQYVDEPGKPVTLHGVTYPDGVVGIPFLDKYVEASGLKFLEDAAKNPKQPFFIRINFMKVHQPNMPAPEFEHKSMSKTKYSDSVCELDARIGHVMDKLKELGLDQNTLVFYTPTTALGRTFILTPATHPSAAPKEQTAKAAAASRPSPSGRAKLPPASGITTSSAAWTSWPPSPPSRASNSRTKTWKASR